MRCKSPFAFPAIGDGGAVNRLESDAPCPSDVGPPALPGVAAGRYPAVRLRLLDTPKIRAGLRLLYEALMHAGNARRDAAEFALEIAGLRGAGLSDNDLRWLVSQRYVRHAEETTSIADATRTFRRRENLAFTDRTCFMLTQKGLIVAKHFAKSSGGHNEHVAGANLPQWIGELRELRFNGELVKRFRSPSPNQELIVKTFQEAGWPPRIDDPLSREATQDVKQRMRDAIKNLNRRQERRLVRFYADGTGQGIRWTALSTGTSPEGESP
jgi:hypothetical protein